MIYNNSRRSIFGNYEELRKPQKNTHPQLSMTVIKLHQVSFLQIRSQT